MPGGLAHVCSVFPQNNEDEHMEFRPLESTTSTYAKCPLRFWYKNHAFLAQVLIYITRFISQYKNSTKTSKINYTKLIGNKQNQFYFKV